MTAEETKALARREKDTIIRIITTCHPTMFGNPYKARDELMAKSLKQLKKMYEDVMKEKWVFDPESPWMR